MKGVRSETYGDIAPDFVGLRQASALLIREFYTNLLQPTFPPKELETLDDLKKSLDENADGVLALVHGRVVGGLVYEDYVHGSVRLLGYLVVDSGIRRHGLGSKLLQLGIEISDGKLVLGEIEDPRYWEASSQDDPAARLRFWAREGCRLLPLPYLQPSLGLESRRAQHLLLIAVPNRGVTLPDTVPGQLVAEFLREYFVTSEGSISEDDSEVRRLLDKCGVEYLELWPLDRLDAAD